MTNFALKFRFASWSEHFWMVALTRIADFFIQGDTCVHLLSRMGSQVFQSCLVQFGKCKVSWFSEMTKVTEIVRFFRNWKSKFRIFFFLSKILKTSELIDIHTTPAREALGQNFWRNWISNTWSHKKTPCILTWNL